MSIINDVHDLNWDEFVAKCSKGNILQTLKWGLLKSKYGWDYEVVVTQGNTYPIAGALILYKKLPFGLGTIAYIPRGPVLDDWSSDVLLSSLMSKIKMAAKRKKAWVIWIEPELLDSQDNRSILYKLGYRLTPRTIQPPRTIMIDLSQDENYIMARMKQKTRYNIRIAKKKGVIVKQTESDIDSFYKLMIETGHRDKFEIHSIEYYRDCINLFSQDISKLSSEISDRSTKSVILVAEYDSHPLAAMILLAIGDTAWYIYGASSSEHRDKMPVYALQWQAILWAKSQGCVLYDLWGVPDEDFSVLEREFSRRDDGLWGVYRFKRGFGGTIVRYIGLWEMPLNPLYIPLNKLWNRICRIKYNG